MTSPVGENAEPGRQLLRAVQVMDRLRSPGGCPWDAEQTHSSLAPYLIEEAYETLDAIEAHDPVALREELGDLLLQVLFHARLAEEAADGHRFGIDEVAADLVAKLVRRHPHVFAAAGTGAGSETAFETEFQTRSAAESETASGSAAPGGDFTAGDQQLNWDAIKKAEKQRESVTDGIALGQPALALAAKLVSRSSRAGLSVEPPAGDGIGDRLLALAAEAVRAGLDPEQELRRSARQYREAIRAAEPGRATGE